MPNPIATQTTGRAVQPHGLRLAFTLGLVVATSVYALQPWAAAGWHVPRISALQVGALVLALALVPLNLGLEVHKWHLACQRRVSQTHAWQAILVGTTLGMVTPNRLGDYWGRMRQLPLRERPAALAATFLCRTSQWGPLYTLSLPLALLLGRTPTHGWVSTPVWWVVGVGGLACALLLPIALGYLVQVGPIPHLLHRLRWTRMLTAAGAHLRQFQHQTVVRVLVLSYLRHGVYLVQFGLLLCATGAVTDFSTAVLLAAAVLVGKSVLPSLTLAELGVREALTAGIGGLLGLAAGPLVLASLLLFAVNLALPALVGAFLLQRPGRAAAV